LLAFLLQKRKVLIMAFQQNPLLDTVDHLSLLVLEMIKGSFLVNANIKKAYRMVLIHPDDQTLLGVQWRGSRFIDLGLLFGLTSAPKIFTALQWILVKQGISMLLHYLDDFVFVVESFEEAEAK